MHELLKEKMGISVANCKTCMHRGSDGDGNYPEIEVTCPICDKIERMGNLNAFPFKKEMKCWEPEFWCSRFVDTIKNGTDEEVQLAVDAFCKAKESIEHGKNRWYTKFYIT